MKRTFYLMLLLAIGSSFTIGAQAASEDDWQALARYEYGQDLKPLLAIDREVIDAMTSPEKRQACAERLANLLVSSETTLPAKQFICFKLQTFGTPAQVPVLAKVLEDPQTADMARMVLESIPGEASLAALQAGLEKQQGPLLVGLIHSLATRGDTSSIDALKKLADHQDTEIVDATTWALGRIGGPEAATILAEKVAQSGTPVPQAIAVPYLRCAWRLSENGDAEAAKAIFQRMSQASEATPNRKAALRGLLRLSGEKVGSTVLKWLTSDDLLERQIAAEQLNEMKLDDATAQTFVEALPGLPTESQALLMEILAAKQIVAIRPAVAVAVENDEPGLKRAAIRCLAIVGDAESVKLLTAEMANQTPYCEIAEESLIAMPGEAVDSAILREMKNVENEDARSRLIEILRQRKATVAVSELLTEAGNKDATVYLPALQALRGLASSDEVPAMIDLLITISDPKHHDEIEKTILVVCEKTKENEEADPATVVLAVFATADQAKQATLLPLLGRLGGEKSLEVVAAAMESDDSNLQNAGVRALCNWPDATVADRLWDLAKTAQDRAYRTRALRAYIRVVSLKSDRPEAETLALLQNAFQLADTDSERRLVLQRVSTVRTIETLRWVVPYLEDPALNQAACQAVVELAHHRFLRAPNKAEFDSALEKVSKISQDPSVTERAKRYQLGL